MAAGGVCRPVRAGGIAPRCPQAPFSNFRIAWARPRALVSLHPEVCEAIRNTSAGLMQQFISQPSLFVLEQSWW